MQELNNQERGDEGRFNHREHFRGDVQITAQIREKGYGHHSAHVSDLSRSGCKVITPMYLNPDRALFITLPGFSPLEAHICRRDRDTYGCQFVNPLHQAIFEHILRAHPALNLAA